MDKILQIDFMNLPIIENIRNLFSRITGLAISFYNPGTGKKDFFPSVERARFCEIIHSCSAGRQRCDLSDQKATRKAIRKASPCVCACHAGLIDVVVPIMVGGRHAGTILTGQFLTKAPTQETFNNIKHMVKGLDIDLDALEESLNEVTVIPQHKIEVAIQVLSLIANYITEKEIHAQLQKKTTEQEKKISEEAMDRLKLENTLKNLRIKILESSCARIPDGPGRMKEKKLIREAVDFIRKNFHHRLSLENVSRAISLSPKNYSLSGAPQNSRFSG